MEIHVANRLIEYTPIGITYTQALDRHLGKRKIDLTEARPKSKALRQS